MIYKLEVASPFDAGDVCALKLRLRFSTARKRQSEHDKRDRLSQHCGLVVSHTIPGPIVGIHA
jgi:hypothetical protein